MSYNQNQQDFITFCRRHELYLPAGYPILSKTDSISPRVSKFGGKLPLLPNSQHPGCAKCGLKMLAMLGQFYIPSLPAFILDDIPPPRRNGLIVFSICPKCLETTHFRIYSEKELDKLHYYDDVTTEVKNMNKFNPRVITGWDSIDMVPNSTIDKIFDLCNNENFNFPVTDVARSLNWSNTTAKAYLGGWPEFRTSDKTPYGFKLFLQLEYSNETTFRWGKNGAAQIWYKPDQDFGEFKLTWASA